MTAARISLLCWVKSDNCSVIMVVIVILIVESKVIS